MPGSSASDETEPSWFGAKQNIIECRVRSGQHEMLVDHADTCGDCVCGERPRTFLSIEINLSRVRAKDAIEHLHCGGFASAIFTDDAMDASALDAKIHAVIGNAVTETFG